MSPYIRSASITSPEEELAVVSKARLAWTPDGMIRVLFVRGSAYERGYQHGYLLRAEVRDNLLTLYRRASSKYPLEEMFSEAYERMSRFIPPEYLDEMQGLAHGSKLPLHVVHAVHALPEISEWGGKRKIRDTVKRMIDGELGTSCSNLCADASATADGKFYTVRILDWGLHRISKLHEYPLITINQPPNGIVSANIGWIGFLGAISGMNAEGITLGEKGYGDPEGETLSGMPMSFLLREVLSRAKDISQARRIVESIVGTNSYMFLISDGKARQSEIFIKDHKRFMSFKRGEAFIDPERNQNVPVISDVQYGGHYLDRMQELLTRYHGALNPELLMQTIIPQIAMGGNFQNVIYDPVDLKFWVAYAPDVKSRAAEQRYTFFDLGQALGRSVVP